MRKFRHEDAQERPMPTPEKRPYEDVSWWDAEVRVTQIGTLAPFYRPTLGETMPEVLTEARIFALGMTEADLGCAHEVEITDRFGHGRCTVCSGWLFHEGWVADGVYTDDTPQYAAQWAAQMVARLPKLRIVH